MDVPLLSYEKPPKPLILLHESLLKPLGENDRFDALKSLESFWAIAIIAVMKRSGVKHSCGS
ncbi:unnamed protein product [Dovyalis caffra]|uniref:Uncharacterized protein n=1 Tax=Dovyalis caffra TaxID=77055 RepID=A0AAV1SN39_9ROSI|nr:unnamed protein product [Dovyalis caffra]